MNILSRIRKITCLSLLLFCPPVSGASPLQQVLPSVSDTGESPSSLSVRIIEIQVSGSTVFTDEDLDAITRTYVNRVLTSEDLSFIRRDLTDLYVQNGYVNSGARIPDQSLSDGVLLIEIVEGRLTEVDIAPPRWFRASHLRNRLNLETTGPLRIQDLQRRLQLLEQDPRISRFAAELRPGFRPGEARLNLAIQEERPYSASVVFDNHQSPTVGSSRIMSGAVHQNLTGFGDALSFTVGKSAGVNPLISAAYRLPLFGQSTTLGMSFSKNDFTVVETPFDGLNVQSESSSYGFTLQHHIYRTLNSEFLLGFTAERIQNRTFMLGEPFSFSLGADRGRSNVTALRINQEWTHRTQDQAVSVQSRFSFGVDLFGATVHGENSIYEQIGVQDAPDGRFFSWLGKLQWARRVGRVQLIFRADVQMAVDPLLATEQLPVGGRHSVRGYRENQLVRDNAVISSVESRVAIVTGRTWARSLELAPFFDFGNGWHTRADAAGRGRILLPVPPSSIYSLGVGVRWNAVFGESLRWNPEFEMYWGKSLVDANPTSARSGSLQDSGIHFSVGLQVF